MNTLNGYCHCFCGRKTNIAPRSHARMGYVRGEHLEFCRGHIPKRWIAEGQPAFTVEPRGFETPCWIWQYGGYGEVKEGAGAYGLVSFRGKNVMTHRLSYEQHVGPIPEGMHIDHLCRNRGCVNPSHLEPVTNADNCRRGAATKLDWPTVDLIRTTPEISNREWGERVGCTRDHIARIRNGDAWQENTRPGKDKAIELRENARQGRLKVA